MVYPLKKPVADQTLYRLNEEVLPIVRLYRAYWEERDATNNKEVTREQALDWFNAVYSEDKIENPITPGKEIQNKINDIYAKTHIGQYPADFSFIAGIKYTLETLAKYPEFNKVKSLLEELRA